MDQTVSTAEAQISQVPHTRVSINPSTVPSNSKKGMAIICTMVLSLPTMCTATLLPAPICAIHSRKEEMAISRPMMMRATSTFTRSICTNISCWLNGAEDLVRHAEKKLGCKHGETSADGRITLKVEEECVAACAGAVAVVIDGHYHERVTPNTLDQLFDGLK